MMSNRYHIVFIILIILFFQSSIKAQKVVYPKTKTVNVVDFYYGTKVEDPYRWLENIDSADVKAWADEENNLTRNYLDSIPYREALKQRLEELDVTPDDILPIKKGERYFYFVNPEGAEQSILKMKTNMDSIGYVVVDPNIFNKDNTVAITESAISNDGEYIAYALSYGGSDWQEIHFCKVNPHIDYDDTLKRCKFVDMAWSPDDSGIYYTKWPNPDSVKPDDEYNYQKIYWHKLGTPQKSDSVIFEMPEDKAVRFSLYLTTDQKYLLILARRSFDYKIDYYYMDLSSGRGFIKFLDKELGYYEYVGNDGKIFYFDLDQPDKNHRTEIISSDSLVFDYVTMVNHCFVIAALNFGSYQLTLYSLEGKFIKNLELPAMGTVSGLQGDPSDSLMFVGFESFVYPRMTYVYNFNTGEFKPFSGTGTYRDISRFVTRQITYKSDGKVQVPMYLTYDKDLPRDGNNPTLLYGYGGFGVKLTPRFSPANILWLENGGVYAVANMRGGGEFGYNWHWAGCRSHKQTSFNDFKNAANWLIKSKITNSSKLAIMGGSNGGLLTAVCMEQSPKLFGAVISQVPVTDMVRFPLFTIGRDFTAEYGDPLSDERAFHRLYAYSPYQNVSLWSEYPSVLVTTGENDDRVPPLHAYKFVAALQAKDDGLRPKLLRVESNAGHGKGKPESKFIEEQTDIYTFLFHTFGMTPKGWQDKEQK